MKESSPKLRSVCRNELLKIQREVAVASSFTGKKTSGASSFLGRKHEAKYRKS